VTLNVINGRAIGGFRLSGRLVPISVVKSENFPSQRQCMWLLMGHNWCKFWFTYWQWLDPPQIHLKADFAEWGLNPLSMMDKLQCVASESCPSGPHVSIYLAICLSVYLSIYLLTCLSIFVKCSSDWVTLLHTVKEMTGGDYFSRLFHAAYTQRDNRCKLGPMWPLPIARPRGQGPVTAYAPYSLSRSVRFSEAF